MSSTSERESDAPTAEELVAYLDGELTADDCRRVEERLANDAEYRQQLRDLDQAWEALEVLPATKADDHFARTTIEMVSVAAEREAEQQAISARSDQRRRLFSWTCAGAILAAIGFVATRALLPDPNSGLLAELPVILQLDVLSQIDTVEFVEQLTAQVPLDKLASDMASIERELNDLRKASDASLEARREWLGGLPSDQKAALAAQAERFNEMDRNPARQQSLRELNQRISQSARPEQLQTALLAYGQWLARQSNGDQEDLRLMPVDQRLKAIQRIIAEEEQWAVRRLSESDRENLRKEILEIAEERKGDFLESSWWRDRDTERGPREPRPQFIVLWAMATDNNRETVNRLIEQLSAERRQYWETLPRRGRDRRDRMQLFFWINDAMNPRRDPADLGKYFASDKLPSGQREWLLSLPYDEMQNQLERLYLATEFGLNGVDEWLGEFGPPGGFGPGRPPGPGGPGGPRPEDGGLPSGARGRGGPPPDGFGPEMRPGFGPEEGRPPGAPSRGRRNGPPAPPPSPFPNDDPPRPPETKPTGP